MRLARKPSLRGTAVSLVLYAVAVAVVAAFVSRFVWQKTQGISLLAVTIGFDLIGLVVFCGIAIRLFELFQHHEALIEIDRESLMYGDSAQLRLREVDTEALADLNVSLIGECDAADAMDFSQHRETIVVHKRCYEEELLRVSPLGESFELSLPFCLPKSAPADEVRWTVVVSAHLKAGGVVVDPYPLPVR